MDRWEVPAEVVAWLCEAVGMPWPLVWRMKPTAHRNPLNGDDWVRLPVDVSDHDAALLIDRRLAAAMGVEGARVAWVVWEWSRKHGLRYRLRWDVTACEPLDLPGIPDGVTDPAAARAWALCWLHGVAMLERRITGVAGPLACSNHVCTTWAGLAGECAVWFPEGLPLLLPIHNGQPCEVPDAP